MLLISNEYGEKGLLIPARCHHGLSNFFGLSGNLHNIYFFINCLFLSNFVDFHNDDHNTDGVERIVKLKL